MWLSSLMCLNSCALKVSGFTISLVGASDLPSAPIIATRMLPRAEKYGWPNEYLMGDKYWNNVSIPIAICTKTQCSKRHRS